MECNTAVYFCLLVYLSVDLFCCSGNHIQHDTFKVFHNKKYFDTSIFSPNTMNLTFQMHHRMVTLNLTRNRHIFLNFPVFVGSKHGIQRWKSTSETMMSAAYTDDKSGATVGVQINNKNGHLEKSIVGVVHVDGQLFTISPSADKAMGVSSASRHVNQIHHVDINGKLHRMVREAPEFNNSFDIPFASPQQEMDDTISKQKYTVEVQAVIDFSLYTLWSNMSQTSASDETLNNIYYYYVNLFNGIDMRYSNIQQQNFTINVRLAGLYIATSSDMSPFSENHLFNLPVGLTGPDADSFKDIDKVYNSFQQWVNNFIAQNGNGFDMSMLFTEKYLGRTNILTGEDFFQGISGDSLCQAGNSTVAVMRDRGLFWSTQFASRLIGVALQSGYDGTGNLCKASDQYIMSSNYSTPITDANRNNVYNFSTCSVVSFRNFLSVLTRKTPQNCLVTTSSAETFTTPANMALYPGQQFTPDQQCQLRYNDLAAYYCISSTGNDDPTMCENLNCFFPATKACTIAPWFRAYEGTTCGERKWCIRGQCVSSDESGTTTTTTTKTPSSTTENQTVIIIIVVVVVGGVILIAAIVTIGIVRVKRRKVNQPQTNPPTAREAIFAHDPQYDTLQHAAPNYMTRKPQTNPPAAREATFANDPHYDHLQHAAPNYMTRNPTPNQPYNTSLNPPTAGYPYACPAEYYPYGSLQYDASRQQAIDFNGRNEHLGPATNNPTFIVHLATGQTAMDDQTKELKGIKRDKTTMNHFSKNKDSPEPETSNRATNDYVLLRQTTYPPDVAGGEYEKYGRNIELTSAGTGKVDSHEGVYLSNDALHVPTRW